MIFIKKNSSFQVYNNLCACLLQQPDASSERIKQLAEVNTKHMITHSHSTFHHWLKQNNIHYLTIQIVIELDSKNEKAWFRRGQACVRLKNFDEAKVSFTKVKEISGGKNKEVGKLLQNCDQELQKRKNKEKRMYQEMFKSQCLVLNNERVTQTKIPTFAT